VKRPLRLAIVDDYAVVIAGVASFLEEERIDVVETGASLPVVSDVGPGRSAGLSSREAEILALITRGLTNQEISERAHVSPNTIKSYIRSAYRKIGVERRTQAMLWAMENGFLTDTVRTLDPALRLRPAPPAP